MSTIPPAVPNSSKAGLGVWLVRLLLIGVLVYGAVFTFDYYLVKHDAAKASASSAALAKVIQDNTKFQAQAAQQIAQLEQQIASLEAANKNIQTTRTTRAAQTKKQQQQDANLTPDNAANRIHQLEPNQPAPTLNPDNTIAVGLSLTEAIIQDLDTIPALKADNADLTQIVANDTTIISDLKTEIITDNSVITGLKNQITAQTATNKATIAALKASARKGKLKWFAIGFGAGFLVREGILLGSGK